MSESHERSRIELGGSFDVKWTNFFEDMLVQEQMDKGTVRGTVLVGTPRDLEAFLGMIHMLVDRGFPVVAFEYRQAAPSKAETED